MASGFEEAKAYLPPALPAADLRKLYDELSQLDHGVRYYSPHDFEHFLQGDTLDGVPYPIIERDGLALKDTRVMLLTNTCDMASGNTRDLPVNVTIAPVVSLESWSAGLQAQGVETDRVAARLDGIRKNTISNLFYLPAGRNIETECVALLDRMQTVPREHLAGRLENRLGVLSQPGHWLLCVKLSVHFCRLNEGVNRQAA